MAVNPDPKPGRWILPLVILGMIAFTYFFVRELPEASPDTTLAGPTNTTAPGGEDGSTSTSESGNAENPELTAYLTEVDSINTDLQVQKTEIVAVNTGFDASPREVEFEEASTRFEQVQTATQALADRFNALSAPSGLETNHDAMKTALEFAALAAGDAISGLRSSDPGDLRRSGVQAYAEAADDFDVEVANTHDAADA